MVAQRIRELLDDPRKRSELSEAGLAFARTHTFEGLAETLVSLVDAR